MGEKKRRRAESQSGELHRISANQAILVENKE
jgi:hypothetical protein